MTQTLESYIQTKANFIADYLFSNSLSPFNGGKSITTPLLGKVVGFYTGIIMPTSGYVGFPVPRCYDSFVTSMKISYLQIGVSHQLNLQTILRIIRIIIH